MPSSIRLRPWQRAALDRFASSDSPDFLAVATPGAGKTTFALAAARQLLAERSANLIVVVPTAHLKWQWTRAASGLDLHLDPAWSPQRGGLPADMHGIVTTYQQVASAAEALARLGQGAVVILDEIHHAGDDRAWGAALAVAFARAWRRLSLSGTPFRSDTASIPFVRYEDDEARPDYEYGYGPALAEHRVVRPVYFPRTNGQMEWSAPDGTLHSASFDDALDQSRANQRLRAALSASGEWLPEVLQSAHARLTDIRRSQPDAGGLVIASDQEHARAIAGLLRQRLATRAVLATSDDPFASEHIASFAAGNAPWLVAVRMVSEGVDIPRLRVGVYATTTTTELFFRQAVGRLVRWQAGVGRQAAYLFIPDDARLRAAAAQIAADRRHSLRRREALEEERSDDAGEELVETSGRDEQLSLFSVISAVATEAIIPEDAGIDEPVGADDDPSLTLELPSLPVRPGIGAEQDPTMTRTEAKEALRQKNAAIARALSQVTGWTHQRVNGELNRLAGLKSVSDATLDELERRLINGERWFRRL